MILLDLLMPVLDGWAFRAEQRRRGHGGIPVVGLSALDPRDWDPEGFGAPILAKPSDLADLLRAIEAIAGRAGVPTAASAPVVPPNSTAAPLVS